jgi:hypothetical protein
MTLSTDRPWKTNGYGAGVYISTVKIVAVEDVSGKEIPFRDRPYDIGLRFTLDVGRDFQPEMLIAGNFKRDPSTGEVTGWGSAFVVQESLIRLGYRGDLDPGNRIPPVFLEGLPGMSFVRLSYVSGTKQDGRVKYTDWPQIATVEEGAESLANRFRKSLTKGYPKNYRPQAVEYPIKDLLDELID